MNEKPFAKALSFEEKAVYYPKVRPGYAAWASLFHFGNGDLGIAFNEIRRGENPDFVPPPLEFVRAMCMVYRECPDLMPGANRDLVSEYVYMKSADLGKTWSETGRCRVHTRHYWHVGFPDGRLVRLIGTQHYRYELGDGRHCSVVEESLDGGNTWKEISRFLEGYFFYGHKFKKLRSGSIVAAGPIMPSFGPGGKRASRHAQTPGQCLKLDACFLISADGGRTWDGPHYILPGVFAWEPDFVELPDGSLLFINSTVQSGKPVRQIVRRTATGYVNEPMMEIHRGAPTDDNVQGGFTPETVVMTAEGLIVGARRGRAYSCSSDLGENWYEIAGAPECKYQPVMEMLPGGEFLTVWHNGCDSRFGECDMFIGTHAFRVAAALPKVTALSLERELSEDGSRYVNIFKARLTAGGEPISGRAIRFRTEPYWRPDGYDNTTPLDESENVRTAITDNQGVARLHLAEKDRIPEIHYSYMIDAVFNPEPGDPLQSCKGPVLREYARTPARNCPANYPVYIQRNLVMITPETAKRFPDLADVVARIDKSNPDVPFAKWVEVAGSEENARRIIAFLLENHLVTLGDDGIYRWYRAIHCGVPVIKEVRICELEEIIV